MADATDYAFDFGESDPKVRELMRSRLELCFAMVADPADVRGPIHAMVPDNPALVAAIRAAIVHYVGEEPRMSQVAASNGGFVLFESRGYRNGPCGP